MAPPTRFRVSLLLQVAHRVFCGVRFRVSSSPGEPAEPSSLRRRQALCLCLRAHPVARLPSSGLLLLSRLSLLGSRRGYSGRERRGCVPGQGQLLALVLCCEGVGAGQAGRRLHSSRFFPWECFNRSAEGTDRLSTPQSVRERWQRQRQPPRGCKLFRRL